MTIYTIQNTITGAMYIGQTASRASKRFVQHLCLLRKGTHRNPILQNSFTKHGEVAFEFGELESFDGQEECDESEKFFINYLRFLGAPIYNLKGGGKECITCSEETRRKISKANKGRGKGRPAHPNTVAAGAKANLGLKRSAETCKKISMAHLGKTHVISEATREIMRANIRKRLPQMLANSAISRKGMRHSGEWNESIRRGVTASWEKRRQETQS